MRFAVVAPVAAGVTADPGWMADFARHVEACGFESLIAVEHTVPAMPPVTDIHAARDTVSDCAHRLGLTR